MIKNPEISVVMAVYNGEKFIKSAIQSVIDQSFKDFEFIIIDDCSTDKTVEIINDFNESRIVYSKNNKNFGQTPSLNKGVKLSKGKYIARIDADDLFTKDKLKIQYKFLEKNPQISVCGTQGKCIDENGKIYSNRLFPSDEKDLIFRSFFQSPLNHVSVLIRTSDFKRVGFYNEKFPICADFELWSRMIIKNYRLININEHLTLFRIQRNSLSFSNKSGQSGKETSIIIQNNINKIIKINLSYKDCRNIVMMLWPSEGMTIEELLNSYHNLKLISKKFYKSKVPFGKKIFLDKILIKSFIKRFLFNYSNNNVKSIFDDLFKTFPLTYKKPKIIIYYFLCILISIIFNKKVLNKIKLLTSS